MENMIQDVEKVNSRHLETSGSQGYYSEVGSPYPRAHTGEKFPSEVRECEGGVSQSALSVFTCEFVYIPNTVSSSSEYLVCHLNVIHQSNICESF